MYVYVRVCVYLSERDRRKKKKLASPKSAGWEQQVGDQGRVDVTVQVHKLSAGRIPFSSGEAFFLLSLQLLG